MPSVTAFPGQYDYRQQRKQLPSYSKESATALPSLLKPALDQAPTPLERQTEPFQRRELHKRLTLRMLEGLQAMLHSKPGREIRGFFSTSRSTIRHWVDIGSSTGSTTSAQQSSPDLFDHQRNPVFPNLAKYMTPAATASNRCFCAAGRSANSAKDQRFPAPFCSPSGEAVRGKRVAAMRRLGGGACASTAPTT
jgi:hypothetical protein